MTHFVAAGHLFSEPVLRTDASDLARLLRLPSSARNPESLSSSSSVCPESSQDKPFGGLKLGLNLLLLVYFLETFLLITSLLASTSSEMFSFSLSPSKLVISIAGLSEVVIISVIFVVVVPSDVVLDVVEDVVVEVNEDVVVEVDEDDLLDIVEEVVVDVVTSVVFVVIGLSEIVG